MEHHTVIFWIIIGILITDYVFNFIIGRLNQSCWAAVLPDKLKGIYDEEKYRNSMEYSKANYKFGLLSGFFSFVVIMGMLFFEGFAFADGIARQISQNPIVMALIFFGGLAFLSDIIGIPFDLYDTFVIEERFGFNRTSRRTWFFDKLKNYLLVGVLGGGLVALLIWFYQIAGEWFWLYAWIVMSAFSIFITMFYSSLIVPLFNKQTPLEAGALRDGIESYAQKTGFKLDNIFVIDGSKRSSKANAYFSGLGPKKRIVLYDTLIKEHTVDELVGVLAHEIGHYKKKHTLKGMIVSILHNGILLYLFGLFVNHPALAAALGLSEPAFHIGALAFGLLYAPVSSLLGIAMNYVSRKHEFQADRFAAETFKAQPLMEALKKLSVNNLSNLTPHPAYVFVNYSHPPLLQRLEHLEQYK